MEHPQILDRVADDKDDNDHDEQADTGSGSWGTSIQPDSPADTEDGSQPSSAMSTVSHRGKKHKHPNALMVVSQLKGSDFWSMVDKWFAARMQPDQLGTSWTTPGWTKYVSICFSLLRF